MFKSDLFKWTFILFLTILFTAGAIAKDDSGYIYGKITMVNGNTYQGVIRWDDEEAFWADTFNSNKSENFFERFDREIKNIDEIEDDFYDGRHRSRRNRRITIWDREFWSDDWDAGIDHEFKCAFGDIKLMEIRSSRSVILTMRNDEEVRVSGGSNDVDAKIRIIDDELDDMELRWNRIESIEFMKTPKKLDHTFGAPLYGVVQTALGDFEGFIQWDNDECVGSDELDGDCEDGDVSIPFRKIKSIEPYRRGSMVILNSGRELYLYGSNDVNNDNRGIVVKNPEWGKVKIGWREFDKITFKEPKNSGAGYPEFDDSGRITAEVTTKKGDKYSGAIIYDLDEAWTFEILDGKDGDIDYLIPFRLIKRIQPERRYGSVVELKSGRTVELEDSRDVDDDNHGVIVMVKNDEGQYIPWRDIKEIVFK